MAPPKPSPATAQRTLKPASHNPPHSPHALQVGATKQQLKDKLKASLTTNSKLDAWDAAVEKAKQAQKEVTKAAASALQQEEKDKQTKKKSGVVAGEELVVDKVAGGDGGGEPAGGGVGAGDKQPEEQEAGEPAAGGVGAGGKKKMVRVIWEVEKLKHMFWAGVRAC